MPATATVLAFILITSIFVGGVNNNSALISYAVGEQLPQQQGSCPDGSQPDSSGNCPNTQPQQPQQQPAPGCETIVKGSIPCQSSSPPTITQPTAGGQPILLICCYTLFNCVLELFCSCN
jgi:hypothetical protein